MQVEKQQKMPGGRIFYLDLIRAIACLMVVMIHVSAEFVIRGTTGSDFWIGTFFDSISRAGVPLFVMISGALMLDESYEFTKEKWRRHIGKMVGFYFFWSAFYSLIYTVLGGGSLWDGFWQMIAGHYHLWFVPMIVGLYLILPLLRLWVKEENIQYVRYFLLLSLLVAFFIPMYNLKSIGPIKTVMENMNLKYVMGYPAYFVLGWYLNRGIERKKLVYALGALAVVVTFAGTALAAVVFKDTSYPFFENFGVNVLAHSAAVFVLCRSSFEQARKPSRVVAKVVASIGQCSLGVYAMHIYVMEKLLGVFGTMHPIATIPLVFVLTMIFCMALTRIFSKIPFLKKVM